MHAWWTFAQVSLFLFIFGICLLCESVSVSHSVVSDFVTPWTVACRQLCLWDSPGKNTGVGSHSFLQGIFLIQGSNPGLRHCRQTLYHLSHQGSPPFLFDRRDPGDKGFGWDRWRSTVKYLEYLGRKLKTTHHPNPKILETAQLSAGWWMEKEMVVFIQ